MKTLKEHEGIQRKSEEEIRDQICKSFEDWADSLDKNHPTGNTHALSIRVFFKNLKDHYHMSPPTKLGVACDDCGCELVDYRHQMLMSNPPKKHADCPQCGKYSYMRY